MMKPLTRFGSSSFVFAAIVALALGVRSAPSAAQHQEAGHHHPEATKIKNPVAADAESLATGKKLFAQHCAECHGEAGKGDGPMAPYIQPLPPDLTDAEWKHGTSDGEIFTVIRDGAADTGMVGFADSLTEKEMWDLVNFLRSLGPKPAKAH